MVFDPAQPPTYRAGFMEWYAQQTEWGEDHGYNDPEVCTPNLRSWFHELRQDYPAMNGPFASDDVDDPRLTDFCIGRSVIYATFAWSEASRARRKVFDAAAKHGLGFFDVSADDGGVWVPNASGDYECVHGGQSSRGGLSSIIERLIKRVFGR